MTIPLDVRRSGRGAHRWLLAGATVRVAAGCAVAGGGGSTQDAPDAVRAGEPVRVALELSASGGGVIARSQRAVQLRYRLVGEADDRPAPPARLEPVDDRRERHVFTIPPFPPGTTGQIAYHFVVTLDGQTTRVPGVKQILVR